MNIVIQKENPKLMAQLNNAINNGNDVFLFISADWCSHCKNMKPEWVKLYKNKYGPNVVVANVNSTLYKDITNFGPEVEGFPDLRYINKTKGINEKFEDSGISDINRTYIAFDKWIKSKTKNTEGGFKKTYKHKKGMIYGKKQRTQRQKSRGQTSKKQRTQRQKKRQQSRRQRHQN